MLQKPLAESILDSELSWWCGCKVTKLDKSKIPMVEFSICEKHRINGNDGSGMRWSLPGCVMLKNIQH